MTIFTDLLKENTIIDHDFIDTFFKKFKMGDDLSFHIKANDVAKYLGIKLLTVHERLANKYSKNKNYIEKADYIKVYSKKKNNDVIYYLNYQCFERLAMQGQTEKSEAVRMYFVKLREFLTDNQILIKQAMDQKSLLRKLRGKETIYFFAVDENKSNIYKVGRSSDILQRLKNYNIGRIKEVDLKYLAVVTNSILIEQCIKAKLDKHKVYNNREIYKIDSDIIKKVIKDCFCEKTSKKEKLALYEDLGDLINFYTFIKKKNNVSPYIIIE